MSSDRFIPEEEKCARCNHMFCVHHDPAMVCMVPKCGCKAFALPEADELEEERRIA